MDGVYYGEIVENQLNNLHRETENFYLISVVRVRRIFL